MKRFRLPILVVAVLGVSVLSGRQLARVFTPSPRQVVAENKASQAALAVIEMDYGGAAHLYERTDADVAGQAFHLRLLARAFMHLGRWEEAARLLSDAGADTRTRGAAGADAARLRGLEGGRSVLPAAFGAWEKLRVGFAQDEGVGPVAVMDDGKIVTAQPSTGRLAVWTSEGRLVRRFQGLGTPAAVTVLGDDLLVADMAGGRVLRLTVPTGAVRALTLPDETAFGIRALAPGAGNTTWIADYSGGRVVRIDNAGNVLATLGGGQLDRPSALLVDGDDLLVAEAGRNRVLRYDRNSRLLRSYLHPRLAAPLGLAAAPGGFLILAENGLVFWAREGSEDVSGPLPTTQSLLQAGTLGIAADRDGNILWGDGRSLAVARRLPEDRPQHLLELLRVQARRGAGGNGQIILTAAVTDKDGMPLESLENPQFRLLKGDQRIVPIAVENLSEVLPGRRILIAMEQSDALFAHIESVRAVIEFCIARLTAADRAAVMDVRDTYTMVRDFTVAPDLVRSSLTEDRRRVATIDLDPAPALRHGILMLAPTDFARAILWVTSGEGLTADQVVALRRMGLVNQVPIFILHVGGANRALLEELAARTGGQCFPLYANATAQQLPEALAKIRSGRYRVAADVALPLPQERGRWFDVTLEAYHRDAVAWDRMGYISY